MTTESSVQQLQHHVDALLEDLAVLLVVGALVGDGGDGAGVLAEHVGPARLVAAGEADPVAALQQVIDDRRLLGEADRVPGADHVAERADVDGRGLAGPEGVEHARVGRHLVALGMEMMLDRRAAPQAHRLGGLDDVGPLVHDALIELAVGAERPPRDAVLEAVGGQHRIEIEDDLGPGHVAWVLSVGPVEGW